MIWLLRINGFSLQYVCHHKAKLENRGFWTHRGYWKPKEYRCECSEAEGDNTCEAGGLCNCDINDSVTRVDAMTVKEKVD